MEIFYEDNDIIVCRKPPGIATQTRRLGEQDMESLLKNYLAEKGETPYIGVVHRLDQPVEGVMVYAKNANTAANLSRQVAQRQIGKYYYALVHIAENNGENEKEAAVHISDSAMDNPASSSKIPSTGWTELSDYMTWNGKPNYASIVPKGTSGAKKAVLEYRIINQNKEEALLDIHLHTGRHHQIRLQMAHAGMPLIGDRKYGNYNQGNNHSSSHEALALCSYRLDFTHPTTGESLSFSILPEHEKMRRMLTSN